MTKIELSLQDDLRKDLSRQEKEFAWKLQEEKKDKDF
jgi:hypothetical protein